MEQNLTLGKKYYAYDLSEIFDFHESVEFLFVFEPKTGNLEFDDAGSCAQVNKNRNVHTIEKWDCSIYDNIYYLFYKPGNNVVFEKLVPDTNEKGESFIDPLEVFEPLLQKHNVEYIVQALSSHIYANILWLNDNGFLLHKNQWWVAQRQCWVLAFNRGLKKIDSKYELNKIVCFDASIVYNDDLRGEMTDLFYESDEKRNPILNSHTELLVNLLSVQSADMDANSFADLVYYLKRHFGTVTVFGAQGSRLCMEAMDLFVESSNPELDLVMCGFFRISENGMIQQRKGYCFRCEKAEDLKTYLVGYIRANTEEKQHNFIAKCIMLGKAYELPKHMSTLDFEEFGDEEE